MNSLAASPVSDRPRLAQKPAKPETRQALQLSLPSIHCAACIGKVERAMNGLERVQDARVNLSLKRLTITGKNVDTDLIVTRLGEIGFEAYPLNADVLDDQNDAALTALLTRVAIAGFAMMNVMLLSVAVWSGATDTTRDMFHLISAAIALPAVVYAAQPFFKNAWTALSAGRLNMDVPISLAIILAAAMSLFESFQGGEHAYFDAALSLTFFLLIGRYLDLRTRNAARSAATELAALEINQVQKVTSQGCSNVPLASLAVDDTILVPTGMRVPVDGVLSSTGAVLDRSFLTGESNSAILTKGARVQAGEINQGGPFELKATSVGEDTTLRRIAGLIERAENARSSYTALADRAARIYAPLVHILALSAFIAWVWSSGDIRHSLNIAIAVLIITCPCALGLAVPAVATAAIGRLYRSGFLVKHDTALERLAEVDTVVFDKTGTLTLPVSSQALTDLNPHECTVLKALAQASGHPVARAITQRLFDIAPAKVEEIEEIAGKGVMGRFKGEIIALGKASWLGAGFEGTGLKIGDMPAKQITEGETLRDGALSAVSALKQAGYSVHLMTGDTAGPAHRIAMALQIDHVRSAMTAQEKHETISAMTEAGQKVVMIGDGLNDTAALSAAHASIAPASALDASRSAADVVVLSQSFEAIPQVFNVARATTRLSKQNFAIAALYNLIAIPIALLGFATPLMAALAMSASSISVLLNALRVRSVK